MQARRCNEWIEYQSAFGRVLVFWCDALCAALLLDYCKLPRSINWFNITHDIIFIYSIQTLLLLFDLLNSSIISDYNF